MSQNNEFHDAASAWSKTSEVGLWSANFLGSVRKNGRNSTKFPTKFLRQFELSRALTIAHAFGIWDLGIPSLFVLRHSSFPLLLAAYQPPTP
jgi:hypothetical protein